MAFVTPEIFLAIEVVVMRRKGRKTKFKIKEGFWNASVMEAERLLRGKR